MKTIHKRRRAGIDETRALSPDDSSDRSDSKRARQDSQHNDFVDLLGTLPPSEEMSSLSSSSRVSSGDSLQALGEPTYEDLMTSSPRTISFESSTPSHVAVLGTSQDSWAVDNLVTTSSGSPKDVSGTAACQKQERTRMIADCESRPCQRNLSKRAIERAASNASLVEPVNYPSQRSRTVLPRWCRWLAILGVVLFLRGLKRGPPLLGHLPQINGSIDMSHPLRTEAQTFYVPGYGFSGFWYILGRLQSIPDPHIRKEYYCYSAGCLGVVAALRNKSMVHTHREAVRIQNQWKSGKIGRYDVVEHFVSWLLLPSTNESVEEGPSSSTMLASLKVITSAQGSAWGIQPVIRTPASIDELREMLIQTTWLPFATGSAVWHPGGHIDGAFTWPFHPACDVSIGLTSGNMRSSLDLLLNVVNVNLSRRKVEEFWSLGVANGNS